MPTNGTIKSFLKDLRDKRTRKYGIEACIVSFDGANSSGKSQQIGRAKSLIVDQKKVYGSIPVRDTRESRELDETESERRQDYTRKISRERVEDIDETLELYTMQRVKAWREAIIPKYCGQKGFLFLDRSAYSTLAIQLFLRGIEPGSREALELTERIFPEPIIPPHVAIFTICMAEIAYERAKKDYERKGLEDYFDPFYITSYKLMHSGEEAPLEVMRRWWCEVSNRFFKDTAVELPDKQIVTTGRNTDYLNPIIERALKSAYRKLT